MLSAGSGLTWGTGTSTGSATPAAHPASRVGNDVPCSLVIEVVCGKAVQELVHDFIVRHDFYNPLLHEQGMMNCVGEGLLGVAGVGQGEGAFFKMASFNRF